MEQMINTVNINLSEYTELNNKLNDRENQLSSVKAELALLKSQEKTNKIIVVDEREYDPYTGGQKTVSKLDINVQDPEVSNVILDIISKVDNSELTTKIKEKEAIIDNLEYTIKTFRKQVENSADRYRELEKLHKLELSDFNETRTKELRKVKKGYEETIETLEENVSKLQKDLKLLKTDKTEAQLEIARQQEMADLRDKINTLEDFKTSVLDVKDNPFKLREFIKGFELARKFRESRRWINNIYSNTITALENIQAYKKVMDSIGVIQTKEKQNTVTKAAYWNGSYYVSY